MNKDLPNYHPINLTDDTLHALGSMDVSSDEKLNIAAQLGADMQLEEVGRFLAEEYGWKEFYLDHLRRVLRPSPLRLVEKSLALIDGIQADKTACKVSGHVPDLGIVRTCLLRLKELEQSNKVD